jgi:formylglycine-generating enzyme required for sulfatase activity
MGGTSGASSSGTSGAGNQSGESQGGAGEGGSAGSGPDPKQECDPEATSCLLCDENGRYVPGSPCDLACEGEANCVTPRSCNGQTTDCLDGSCCLSLPVPGGAFKRGCDYFCQLLECPDAEQGYPASVSHFSVDAFEVTVSRFRPFVFAYQNAKPGDGDGANPNNTADEGWQSAWNQYLPAGQSDLLAQLSSDTCGEYATFRDVGNDELPVNCVSWYVAQAFCIWDHARLPTEAEWSYVASGGDEQRLYPWWNGPDDGPMGQEYATYYLSNGPLGVTPVGSHADGIGKWLHYDLAGNVGEWVWDGFEDCYGTTQCDDCGRTEGQPYKSWRGGSFLDDQNWIQVPVRGGSDGTLNSSAIGFRCARDL